MVSLFFLLIYKQQQTRQVRQVIFTFLIKHDSHIIDISKVDAYELSTRKKFSFECQIIIEVDANDV